MGVMIPVVGIRGPIGAMVVASTAVVIGPAVEVTDAGGAAGRVALAAAMRGSTVGPATGGVIGPPFIGGFIGPFIGPFIDGWPAGAGGVPKGFPMRGPCGGPCPMLLPKGLPMGGAACPQGPAIGTGGGGMPKVFWPFPLNPCGCVFHDVGTKEFWGGWGC